MEKIEEKPLEEWTPNDIKECFLDIFFWVAQNRPDWLQEAVDRQKRIVGPEESARRLAERKTNG